MAAVPRERGSGLELFVIKTLHVAPALSRG